MCVTKYILFYDPVNISTTHQIETLIDTGAQANALKEGNFGELESFGTQPQLSVASKISKIKVASGQLVHVLA